MAIDPTDSSGGGIPVEVSEPRAGYARRVRKKSAWVTLVQVGLGLGLVAGLAGAACWVLLSDPTSLEVLPIADQQITQGDELKVDVSVRREGFRSGSLIFGLEEAPSEVTIDKKSGKIHWSTTGADKPGTYELVVDVRVAGSRSPGARESFQVALLKRPERRRRESSADRLSFSDAFNSETDHINPFDIEADLSPQGKIDELVFAKLEELKIEPANLCSDGVFLRRVHLDTIGTLPTAEEARKFLDDEAPKKRALLIDQLLERPEFADYWAMKWSDLLRVKAEFPINLWPNAAQAYHRWIRNSIEENMPYDQFVRELLTSCGSNFRTPQVNFYRALQSKEPAAITRAVGLAFMGVRVDNWPEERQEGMAVFFSQVGFKPTREWKEEIIVFDPRKARPAADDDPSADAKTVDALGAPVFPDGTPGELTPGVDPREIFADWLIDAENPWFCRHIVNRVWYWVLGRGIVHEPDDIRPDNPAQNGELLNLLAAELVAADYDLKHIFRLILNSKTYQLSCVPKSEGPEAAANFACYGLRRLEAEVISDAICQITGTTEFYSSMIPEPFTFIPEKQRSITLPDGSITSSFLEMFGRPPRDTGLESERNNRITAAQALHLLNSTHILRKLQTGPKIRELFKSSGSSNMGELLYLTILSRLPTDTERDSAWQGNSEDLAWALMNSDEFLFRH